MRIGFDASRIKPEAEKRTGVEWYSYYLLKELAKIDSRNQYFLYSPDDQPADLGELPTNFVWKKLSWPLTFGWSKIRLLGYLLFNRPEVLFVPAYILPLIKVCKQVITWHDFNYQDWPQAYSSKQLKILIRGWQKALFAAEAILVPSQATKNYAVKHYPVAANKIFVTPLGVDTKIFKISSAADILQLKQKYNLTKPYLFFVGRLEAKKNIKFLIETFLVFNKKYGQSYQLVLAGGSGVGFKQVDFLIKSNADSIKVINNFSRQELATLYSGAACFVFPTLAEGFGLPVLESLACFCPAIVSDLEVLREVGGLAVNYFKPSDPGSLIKFLEEVLIQKHLLSKELAFEQIKNFSWSKTAQKTLDILEKIYFDKI